MDDNKRIWSKVYHTNPIHTEPVRNRSGEILSYSVDAYRQIERATEMFGPFGEKWGVRDEKFSIRKLDMPGSKLYTYYCIYTGTLFYPNGIIPIHSDAEIVISTANYTKYSQGWSKKVATNALTKGLSKLGFNADVFQDRFSDSKYVQAMNSRFRNTFDKKEKVSKDMVAELNDMLSRSGLAFSKVIGGLNKTYNTNFSSFEELHTYHYVWLKSIFENYYL